MNNRHKSKNHKEIIQMQTQKHYSDLLFILTSYWLQKGWQLYSDESQN